MAVVLRSAKLGRNEFSSGHFTVWYLSHAPPRVFDLMIRLSYTTDPRELPSASSIAHFDVDPFCNAHALSFRLSLYKVVPLEMFYANSTHYRARHFLRFDASPSSALRISFAFAPMEIWHMRAGMDMVDKLTNQRINSIDLWFSSLFFPLLTSLLMTSQTSNRTELLGKKRKQDWIFDRRVGSK